MPQEFGPEYYDEDYFGHGEKIKSGYNLPYNSDRFSRSIRYGLWAIHAFVELRAKMPRGPMKVLDVGGATGLFGHYLRHMPGVIPYTIDLSNWTRENIKPTMAQTASQGDACMLPFEAQSFEGVTCFDVLEHVVETNIPGVLVEMKRVLKSDGRGVVVVNVGTWEDFEQDESHVTKRDIGWWAERFCEAGFSTSPSVMNPITKLPGRNSTLRKKLTVFHPGLLIVDNFFETSS